MGGFGGLVLDHIVISLTTTESEEFISIQDCLGRVRFGDVWGLLAHDLVMMETEDDLVWPRYLPRH